MNETEVRLPPSNSDAEKALICSLLRNPHEIAEAVQLVKPSSFYSRHHQVIFACLMDMDSKGKRLDLVTVAEVLTKSGEIDDAGGLEYLAELWEAAPSAANLRYYAEIIREKAIARNLINACQEIQANAWHPGSDAGELLSQAERMIGEISESSIVGELSTVQEAISEMWDRMDTRRKATAAGGTGVMTGFLDLDAILAGLQNSEVSIIAARPSVGKTALALNITINAIRNGVPVFFVSLEQAKAELAERMVCTVSGVDSHKIRSDHLSASDIGKLQEAADILSQTKLTIDELATQTITRIAANARRLKRQKKVGLVIVDYLQLIDPEDRRAPRQEQVAAISRRFKFLARDLKIPVVVLAQLNRESEKGVAEPRLSQLRESGSIEQDADVVMLMWRPVADSPEVEVIVAKNRNGKTGRLRLVYQKECMRFNNYSL